MQVVLGNGGGPARRRRGPVPPARRRRREAQGGDVVTGEREVGPVRRRLAEALLWVGVAFTNFATVAGVALAILLVFSLLGDPPWRVTLLVAALAVVLGAARVLVALGAALLDPGRNARRRAARGES